MTGTLTAFDGDRLLVRGSPAEVALAVAARTGGGDGPALVFDDRTGRVVDLDLSGGDAAISARYAAGDEPASGEAGSEPATAPRGRGRPRLGVVAREVTLLPRHWEWLAAQPGGASQALRRLVEDARRDDEARGRPRAVRDAAYNAMSVLAGDRPGFEEASRAHFAGDAARFERLISQWPPDVARYLLDQAAPSLQP